MSGKEEAEQILTALILHKSKIKTEELYLKGNLMLQKTDALPFKTRKLKQLRNKNSLLGTSWD